MNLFQTRFRDSFVKSKQFKRFGSAVPNRKPFSKLEEKDISFFKTVLSDKGVITDPTAVATHNLDWLRKYRGNGQLVLKPQTTEEVSQILKYCNERKLAVCPQGGITGLVGGSVPVYDEVIVNLSRMNKILNFEQTSGIITVEPGVILAEMESYLNQKGYCAPLDLGAKGSCQIGGNASTNAGGIRLLRYGSLHGNILGLRVVLANGEILDSLTTMRKDNTGYDLKQLFIGAEGTLGILTGISILCPPHSASVTVTLLGTNDFEKAQKLLVKAKRGLGEILSAYEFWDDHCMELLMNHFKPDLKEPFSKRCKFYVLVETSGSVAEHDKEKVNKFLENAFAEELIDDGLSAESDREQQAIWKLRESITTALLTRGKPYKYDISVPIPQMYDLVEQVQKNFNDHKDVLVCGYGHLGDGNLHLNSMKRERRELKKIQKPKEEKKENEKKRKRRENEKVYDHKDVLVCGYGHLGDGNLHLNIVTPEFSDVYLNKIEPFVYEYASKYRGSVSAEHGIGVMKPGVLHYSKSKELIETMKQIKKTMDPNGILNPYKVLPE